MTVIITATSIELVEGVCSIPKIYDFVKEWKLNQFILYKIIGTGEVWSLYSC
jgi:hypothetical protein